LCGSGGGVQGFEGAFFGFGNLDIDVGIVIVGVGRSNKVRVKIWLDYRIGSRDFEHPGWGMILCPSLVCLGSEI